MNVLDVDGRHVDHHHQHGNRRERQRRRPHGAGLVAVQAHTGHDGGSDGADGARLIDRGDTHDDGAEHDEDQSQRRHQDHYHPQSEVEVVLALVVNGRRQPGAHDGDGENEVTTNLNPEKSGEDTAEKKTTKKADAKKTAAKE